LEALPPRGEKMKLSKYIKQLEVLFETEGDVEVDTYRAWDRIPAPDPKVAFRKILKGRETKPRFWNWAGGEAAKGAMVIKV